MTPTETAAAILSVVFFMVMIVVAVQSAENQRRERQLNLLNILNTIRGAEHLLNNIPSIFLTQSLRSLLTHYLENLWQQAYKLDRSIDINLKIQTLQNLSNEPINTPEIPKDQLTLFPDRNTAQRNRSLLRETAQMLTELRNKAILDNSLYQSQLQIIKSNYMRCDADLLIMEAEQDLLIQRPMVAIHKLRTAKMKLAKLPLFEEASYQLINIQNTIEQLDNEVYHHETTHSEQALDKS